MPQTLTSTSCAQLSDATIAALILPLCLGIAVSSGCLMIQCQPMLCTTLTWFRIAVASGRLVQSLEHQATSCVRAFTLAWLNVCTKHNLFTPCLLHL